MQPSQSSSSSIDIDESIEVARFVRFNVGEMAEPEEEEDFAAEVEKMKAGK